MDILIVIFKTIGSFFMIGLFIGGLVKLSPAHRNPDISPVIEHFVGAIGLGLGIASLYYMWFV